MNLVNAFSGTFYHRLYDMTGSYVRALTIAVVFAVICLVIVIKLQINNKNRI